MATSRVEEARKVQERLRKSLIIRPLTLTSVRLVCGVDVSYLKDRDEVFATAVLLTYPDLGKVQEVWAVSRTEFPYIPGYLAFREVPVIVRALSELRERPDLLCVDGHGIAHPRRFGIASHLGVVTGIASVGVAKKKLVGDCVEPPDEKGAWTPILLDGEVVGAALRTREGVKPVFVSPGHLTDLESSLEFVISVAGRYRIPEPVRLAHQLTVKVRKEWMEKRGSP